MELESSDHVTGVAKYLIPGPPHSSSSSALLKAHSCLDLKFEVIPVRLCGFYRVPRPSFQIVAEKFSEVGFYGRCSIIRRATLTFALPHFLVHVEEL